jgi:hypothetical protein
MVAKIVKTESLGRALSLADNCVALVVLATFSWVLDDTAIWALDGPSKPSPTYCSTSCWTYSAGPVPLSFAARSIRACRSGFRWIFMLEGLQNKTAETRGSTHRAFSGIAFAFVLSVLCPALQLSASDENVGRKFEARA